MGLFRKLADLVSGSPAQQSLLPSELSAVKRLRSSEDWPSFVKLLDEAIATNAEALLASRDAYTDTYYKGVVAGLRKAGLLVDELLAKEQEIARYHERTANAANRRNNADAVGAALYGTPAWTARTVGQRAEG